MHMSGVNKTYETRLDHKKTVLEISYHRVFNGGKPKFVLQSSVYQRE